MKNNNKPQMVFRCRHTRGLISYGPPRLSHNASHTCCRCPFILMPSLPGELCYEGGSVIFNHFGAFLPPPPSDRRAEGENMDEHGVNYIKATAVYLYDNGPLCAELHGCGFAIPVKKKVTVRK